LIRISKRPKLANGEPPPMVAGMRQQQQQPPPPQQQQVQWLQPQLLEEANGHPKMVLHNCVALLNTAGQRMRKNIVYMETKTSDIVLEDGTELQSGWYSEVKCGNEVVGRGEARTKKVARMKAAFAGLSHLNIGRPFTWRGSLPMPKDSVPRALPGC